MSEVFPVALVSNGQVLAERRGPVGVLTLNRPQALNALSLPMIRDLAEGLRAWLDDPSVLAIVLRANGRPGKPPAFCAGGDIRFFHEAALAGDPRLEDFFTEEYALNHLIHQSPKPLVALMDGICMGGGMGLSQGARFRVVTEHSKLAMPETHIGLFPDVGGGWFLARCPGHWGEFLGLTGEVLGPADSLALGLADVQVPSDRLESLVDALCQLASLDAQAITTCLHAFQVSPDRAPTRLQAQSDWIEAVFSGADMAQILAALAVRSEPEARRISQVLAARSPLMCAVTLEQIRRARHLTLAEDLRMERDMVRHCFHLRPGSASETVEGIRALVVDKDHQPRWNPQGADAVTEEMVQAFFASPWPAAMHPLRHLNSAR